MSHVVECEMEIKDLEALKQATEDIGLEFVENQKHYKWFGRSVGDYPIPEGFKASDLGKCEHAIRIPGNSTAYEVGVVKKPNGEGYTLLQDFWADGYGMVDKIGKKFEKLSQPYVQRLTENHYKAKGYRVTTEALEDGRVKVLARR